MEYIPDTRARTWAWWQRLGIQKSDKKGLHTSTLKWHCSPQWILAPLCSGPNHDEPYTPPAAFVTQLGACHQIPALDFTFHPTIASLQTPCHTFLTPIQHGPMLSLVTWYPSLLLLVVLYLKNLPQRWAVWLVFTLGITLTLRKGKMHVRLQTHTYDPLIQ